jgi:hypothetical protein
VAAANRAGPDEAAAGRANALVDAAVPGFRRAAVRVRHDAAAGEGLHRAAQNGKASAISLVAGGWARFREQPIAGILLWTDGNATDWDAGDLDWKSLPPIYPVVLGARFRVGRSIGRPRLSQPDEL